MANEEQLRILKEEGVGAWNKWRKKNPDVQIDLNRAHLERAILRDAHLERAHLERAILSGANLNRANLERANLSGAHLEFAILSGANLNRAILRDANLERAILRDAHLERAHLERAHLERANLSSANLSGANLSGAHLEFAILSGANLSGAHLSGAHLSGAYLERANLSGKDLSGKDLSGKDLSGSNLSGANLERANLERAILSGANLERANLFYAMLATVQALKTNFSSANLTGACIEDWNINKETNLENVSCDYIYLKQGQQERLPHDLNRTFKPGEFTKYIEKALNTVDLIFLDGIDWKAFLLSLKELQDEYREENVGVQAIERKSDGAFVVRIEVPPEADKAEIESKAKQSYETKLQVLEAQYRAELQAKDREITLYKEQGSNMMEIARLLASRPINVEAKAVGTQDNRNINLDLKGASVASAYTEKIEASQVAGTVQGNQIGTQYNSPQKQTLAEAAAEIQKLLKQLEQTNPTATPEQQQAYVDAAISPTLKERCVSALKAGSETAIDEFFNNPYVKVGKAIVMAWIQP